ncbi:MAG: phosphotransferase enzyme family protein [Vulcanococcus sp.]
MSALDGSRLWRVAEAFHGEGCVSAIDPLGSGNVNDTYLVNSAGGLSVLQRINTAVFQRPELVMHNLHQLSLHMQRKLQQGHPALGSRRWEHPQLICTRSGDQTWHCCEAGGFWRSLSFIPQADTVDVIAGAAQARELGSGLGVFHSLISDLPVDALADPLEGFHITPLYLEAYRRALAAAPPPTDDASRFCMAFIRDREALAPLLEEAKGRGELPLRPIHGDPKINNVMLDRSNGRAVALIDLDTVKPGLVHYDIGDCLRSCCNPLGEETTDLNGVVFDLPLAAAILEGYLAEAGALLTAQEVALLPDAARLISFELGLRFFTDHLNGNVYFKARHPQHNLQRALVQFRLTASIEAQMEPLRQLVRRLQGAQGQPA